MNKTELIQAMVEKTGLKRKDVETMINTYWQVTTETLAKGEAINLVGIGSFEVTKRAARQGRNPKTGEAITLAASNQVKFKAGKSIKDAVNAKAK